MDVKEYNKIIKTLRHAEDATGGFSYRRTLKTLQKFLNLKPVLEYQDQLKDAGGDKDVDKL